MARHCPFDVLSPTALKWLAEDLSPILVATTQDPASQEAFQALKTFEDNRQEGLGVEGKVRWLLDHYPKLPVGRISEGLGVSKSVVHRYRNKRDDQRDRLRSRGFKGSPFSYVPTNTNQNDISVVHSSV